MAEWRAMHVRVCTDARLVMLDEWIQLLYHNMIVHADDFGRLTGNPIEVKIKCVPASSRNFQEITAGIQELHNARLIDWYEVDGVKVIQLTDWDAEQPKVLIGKRTKSKYSDNLQNDSRNFQEFPGISSLDKTRQDKTRQEVAKDTHPKSATVIDEQTAPPPPAGAVPPLPDLDFSGLGSGQDPTEPTLFATGPDTPKAKKPKPEWDSSPKARMLLFEHWARLFRSASAKMQTGDKRDKAIASMLRHYPPEDLKASLDGYASDEWRKEKPERNELATLFRDSAHVETGLEAHRRPKNASTTATRRHAGGSYGSHIQRGPTQLGYGDEDRFRAPRTALEILEG